MTQAVQAEELVIRDLFTREVRPIHNWCEWLKRWQVAESFEEMIGLLHAGFNVSLGRYQYRETEYDNIDRLIFYFTMADGWDDHYLLKIPEDGEKEYEVRWDRNRNRERKTPSELRQHVARKAFDMLCLNFFKVDLLDDDRKFKYIWEKDITSERLFPIIQNFFRAEERRFGDRILIRNLSYRDERPHSEQQAVDFLLHLAKFIWGWKEREVFSFGRPREEKEEAEKKIRETRIRIDASKPWMVEVLSGLGKLGLLREWMLDLDEICLAKIKEIALRNELTSYQHPVNESRYVGTIEEACFLGSSAAWFLKEYELKKAEHARLTAILEAERRIAEARRDINALASKE